MTTYETTPLGVPTSVDLSTHAKPRSHEIWTAPILALAATGAFALVVNLVRFGFARDWLDPAGYVFALLEPLILTFPGYLVVRVVLGRGDLSEEVAVVAQALRRASLSIACYAPVIWFYLLTSPTQTKTFPTIAFSVGALAFWTPLVVDLLRRSKSAVFSLLWVALMVFAEASNLLAWLARGIEGRMS